MVKLPQRDDLIYKEIEEFQEYELTNCIAYEMAIRNTELKKLLKKIMQYPLYEFSPYEDKHNELDEKLEKNYFINFDIRKHIEKSYEEYLKKYHKEFYERQEYIKVMIVFKNKEFEKHIIDNIIEYDDKVQNYFYSNFERLKFEYDEFTTEENKIHSNSKPLIHKLSVVKIDGKSEIVKEKSPCIAIIEDRNFLRFKRPRLSIHKELDKTINFNINLNLPKEELIAYISKIKDDFDKDNSIIKTPLELLGETLEKSNNNKTPKKPKASVYADWFYIYDYWKYEKALGKTDKDIFVALEVENNIPYKEDMLRKIRDKMKYFIDDLGYKELITGVKNS
ncbi:MAG: hypothetical protein PHV52_07265 [Aliarcobacter sp.]|nr:hypothetical protein [Aliarcobacter sp.]